VRWLAANSEMIPGSLQAQSTARELAALQAAVWALTGSKELNGTAVIDPQILDRAGHLVNAAKQAGVSALDSETSSSYPVGCQPQLRQEGEARLQSVDYKIALRDQFGPLRGQTVYINDSHSDYAVVTNSDGEQTLPIRYPKSDANVTASWRATLPPGVLLQPQGEGDGPIFVAPYGLPVRCDFEPQPLAAVNPLNTRFWTLTAENLTGTLSSAGRIGLIGLGLLLIVVLVWTLSKVLSNKTPAVVTLVIIVATLLVYLLYEESPYVPQPPPVMTPSQSSVIKPQRVTNASSCYPSQGSTSFEPKNTIDGQPESAWISAPRHGSGATLTFDLGAATWVSGVVLLNGWHASQDLYSSNGRASQVELVFDGGFLEELPSVPDQYQDHPVQLPASVAHLTRYVRVQFAEYTDDFQSVAVSEVSFLGIPGGQHDEVRLSNFLKRVNYRLSGDQSLPSLGCHLS
jgi:hypothetical protein